MKKGNGYRTVFDFQTQAGYIYLKEQTDINITKKIGADVFGDFDSKGKLVGIELLLTNSVKHEENDINNNIDDVNIDEEMNERAENYNENKMDTYD
jgi:uncharacterized protein YuzE